MIGERDLREPLTSAFPKDDERPSYQHGREGTVESERRRDKAKPEPLAYGRLGSRLFDVPTPAENLTPDGLPKARHRFPIHWLITRALLGETAPREALIELVWRVGHSEALQPFDQHARDAAIAAVVEKLLGYGMLGLGLAVHFDVRRSGAFLGWLITTLRHAATDELRRRRTVTIPDIAVTADEDGEEREDSLSARVERHDSEGRPIIPGAALREPARDAEIKQRLAIALAAVNEREREILLSLADGESPEQIAERLNLSAGRVRAIAAAARGKAKAALAAAV